ncbi:MAG: glycosyltransferase family 2 protein [Lachnospiraceae bacterium]|nr:glycosyltransferase family 2 protein [Lachnospiraceae bacterium]
MVSVIVPVYKSEKTLERCVNSLLAQTYTDIEILLVVDGTPDSSGRLSEQLAASDSRIRVLNQKNMGVSASRNHGLAEARGEYIRFVDSDDYVQPDSVAILVDAMERTGAELVIAGFHHQYFGRNILKLPPLKQHAKEIGSCEAAHQAACQAYDIRAEEAYVYELYQAGFLNMPWNKLYKRSLIEQPFRRELNLGEDLLFNLAYMQQAERFAVVQAPVCEYIQDDRGTTLSTKRRENKLALTMKLYQEVGGAFRRLYPSHTESPVLKDKLVSEFLDDLEGLAFEKTMTAKEKKRVIRMYEKQLDGLLSQSGERIHLYLLDYKIIYFFMKRKQTNMVYLLVNLRGILVRLLHKR